MSGIVGGINLRSSGLVNISSASDGTVFTGTGAGLPVGFEAAAGGGKILQVPTPLYKTDSFTTSSTSYVDVTDVTLDITPSATSSKVMIFLHLLISPSASGHPIFAQFLRDSTVIGSGTGSSNEDCFASAQPVTDGNRQGWSADLMWLDAPSTTDAVTYKLQVRMYGASAGYVGRSSSVHIYAGDYATSLTLMEIGA